MEGVHREMPTEAWGPSSELIKAFRGLEGGGGPGMGLGPVPSTVGCCFTQICHLSLKVVTVAPTPRGMRVGEGGRRLRCPLQECGAEELWSWVPGCPAPPRSLHLEPS